MIMHKVVLGDECTDLGPANLTFAEVVAAVAAQFQNPEDCEFAPGDFVLSFRLADVLKFKFHIVEGYTFADAIQFPEGMTPEDRHSPIFAFDVQDLGPFFVWQHAGRYFGSLPTYETCPAVAYRNQLTFFDFVTLR